jgi:hypothetical protein
MRKPQVEQKHLNRGLNRLISTLKILRSLAAGASITIRDYSGAMDHYADLLTQEARHRGWKTTLQLAKSYLRVGQCLAVGQPFTPVPWRKTIKGTSIPHDLRHLVSWLQGSPIEKRIGLTILSMFRLIHLPPEIDLGGITSKGPSLVGVLENFTSFLKGWRVPHTGSPLPKIEDRWTETGFLSSKNGPNGRAVLNAHLDLWPLMKDEKLFQSVKWLLDRTLPLIGENLQMGVDSLKKSPIELSIPTFHSKISTISEGGGKSRNIAIIDYWSQNSLLWIHDFLMETLRRIPEDGTYNQEDAFKIGIKKANLYGFCASFDLSSATDRFPVALQVPVIAHLFGQEVADHWKTVLCDRDFYSPLARTKIRWEVGQPLGALSSWAAFALTHHLVIKYLAKDYSFDKYLVLGDDVMIFDPVVSEAYKGFMEQIGVSINLSKSFVSQDPSCVHGEFAKRLFFRHDEISALPPKIVMEARDSIYAIPDLLNFLEGRWDLIIPGRELYAPGLIPWLSTKGRSLLSIVLSVRQIKKAGVAGYPWCCFRFTNESLTRQLIGEATEKLMNSFNMQGTRGVEQRDQVFAELLKYSEHVGGKPLREVTTTWIRETVHPIKLASISVNGLLAKVQNKMEKVVDPYTLEKVAEFMPDLGLNSIHYDRKTVRNRNLGKIGLQFYYSNLRRWPSQQQTGGANPRSDHKH